MDTTQKIRRTTALAFAFGALALGGCAPSVDDGLVIDSLHTEYVLDRTDDGTAVLDVTETFTVRFPAADVNHGIRRELSTLAGDQYTPVEVLGVTDADGRAVPYSADADPFGPEVIVVTGDDDFVHGVQEYVLHYRQRNVVFAWKYGAHLSWNVNGTGWSQPFGRVSARVRLADGLRAADAWGPACWLRTEEDWLDEDCEVRSEESASEFEFDSLGGPRASSELAAGTSLVASIYFAEDDFVIETAIPWQPHDTTMLLTALGMMAFLVTGIGTLIHLSPAGSGAGGSGGGDGGFGGGGDGGGGGA